MAVGASSNRSSLKPACKTRVLGLVRMVEMVVANGVGKVKGIIGCKRRVPKPEIAKGILVATAAFYVLHLGEVEIRTLVLAVATKTVGLRNIGAAGKIPAVGGLGWAAETVAAYTFVDELLALRNECRKNPVEGLAGVRRMTSLAPVYRADARMNAGNTTGINRQRA